MEMDNPSGPLHPKPFTDSMMLLSDILYQQEYENQDSHHNDSIIVTEKEVNLVLVTGEYPDSTANKQRTSQAKNYKENIEPLNQLLSAARRVKCSFAGKPSTRVTVNREKVPDKSM
ncbi:hypothetical protein HGM15179_008853 [Zosterops borbonicus]|uniref:Uncharacterized protein n=1 Tax=Zosterops borbonicus TaxID=364589 RepID=A0A8K1GIP3_9PASS|nr:hypothetical protein HGM15179_008853 [Zosterops borbonicus]